MARTKQTKKLIAEILHTARRLTVARDALLRGSGMTSAQLRLLKTIRRLPVPLTISALARAMDVSRQAARLTVHELEHIGALSLAPSPCDGKAQIVALTPLGQRRLELVSGVEERWVTNLTDGFDDRSLAQAAWVIRLVRERALACQR